MKRTFFVGLLAAVVFVLDSAPSHSGHNTMEHDTVNFYYEPAGNYLVGQTMSSCYLAKLTKDEQDHVHTNRGMEDLEVSTFVALGSCASSHHGPPVEHSTVNFYYDPEGSYLVAQTASRCFMAKLNREEQDHVHTNTGMDDLELKMLREMLGKLPETKIYHDDAHLPANIQRWCQTRDIYILERPLDNVMTTLMSIIG